MPMAETLSIQTANVTTQRRAAHRCFDAPGPGGQRYATVAISDMEWEMDAPTRERIFEPFFTTSQSAWGRGSVSSSVLCS